jgi:hypothetical protein
MKIKKKKKKNVFVTAASAGKKSISIKLIFSNHYLIFNLIMLKLLLTNIKRFWMRLSHFYF